MANYKKYPRRRRVVKAKAPYKKRAAKAKTTTIKKVVNQILSRKVETKVMQYGFGMSPRCVSASTTQAQFDSCQAIITPQGAVMPGITTFYPIIANGVGQEQRIGDEVKIKGQYLDYIVAAEEYSATTNPFPTPQIVTIWILKPKNKGLNHLTVGDIQSSSTANFFEAQINQESGLTGNYSDLLRTVDKDNYTIVARRQHKVGYQGILNSANSVTTFQQNDYKQYYKGRIRIPGYTWKVDRLEQYQGRNLIMFVQCIGFTGVSVGSGFIPVDINCNLTTYYTDM